MKLLKNLFLLLPLALILTACGSGEVASFDPSATATALLESDAFSEQLEPIDSDIACALYYLDESIVTNCVMYGSTGATAEEIAVFVLTDAEATEQAMAALTARVEDQIMVLESYLPAEISKLDTAYIAQQGNSVLLVVANDIDAAKAALN